MITHYTDQSIQLRVVAEECFMLLLLAQHEGLDVNVETVGRRTVGCLGSLLTLLKEQRHEGKQRVSVTANKAASQQ